MDRKADLDDIVLNKYYLFDGLNTLVNTSFCSKFNEGSTIENTHADGCVLNYNDIGREGRIKNPG
jgi:hypothetical protein